MDPRRNKYFLPAELWLIVIEEATYCPGEGCISDWTGNYDLLEMGRFNRYDAYITVSDDIPKRRSWLGYQTRRSLALVSKTWNKVSTRIMYRSLLIENDVQIYRLVLTLRSKPERRAFVQFFITNAKTPMQFYREYEKLDPKMREELSVHLNIQEIYQTCPNLVFVDDRWNCGTLLQLHLQGEVHPKKLQIFDGRICFHLRGYRILDFFDQLWTYQSLRLLTLTFEENHTKFKPTRISLPNLEVLGLMIGPGYGLSMDYFLSAAEFPKLHSFHICVSRMADRGDFTHPLRMIPRICENMGRQLLTLSVEDHRDSDVLVLAPSDPAAIIRPEFSLDEIFPNLQQLIVNDTIIPRIFHEMAKAARVRILEVRSLDRTSAGAYANYLNRTADHNVSRDYREVTILDENIGINLLNLEKLRLSAPFNLSGEEYVSQKLLSGLHGFLNKHGATVRARGIAIETNMKLGSRGEREIFDRKANLTARKKMELVLKV